jgi:hypothetical protein
MFTGVAVGPAMYRCTMQDGAAELSVEEPVTYSFTDNFALRVGKVAMCAHELSATHFSSWTPAMGWRPSFGDVHLKLEKLVANTHDLGLASFAGAQRLLLNWAARSSVAPQEQLTNASTEVPDNRADRAALEDAYAFLVRARQLNGDAMSHEPAADAVAEQSATIGESPQESAETVAATEPESTVQPTAETLSDANQLMPDLVMTRFQYSAVDAQIGDRVELLVGTLVVIAVAGIALVVLPNQSRAGTTQQQQSSSEESGADVLTAGAETPKAAFPATPMHARDSDAWHTPHVAAESPMLGSYVDEAETPVSNTVCVHIGCCAVTG